jgi:hypothetical protein
MAMHRGLPKVAMVLYLLSFGVPVMDLHSNIFWGFQAFIASLGSLFMMNMGVACILGLTSWLANPCFWIACVAFVRKRYGRAFGWCLVSIFWGLTGLPWFVILRTVDASRWGLLGYWVWLFSFVLLAVVATSVKDSGRGPDETTLSV